MIGMDLSGQVAFRLQQVALFSRFGIGRGQPSRSEKPDVITAGKSGGRVVTNSRGADLEGEGRIDGSSSRMK